MTSRKERGGSDLREKKHREKIIKSNPLGGWGQKGQRPQEGSLTGGRLCSVATPKNPEKVGEKGGKNQKLKLPQEEFISSAACDPLDEKGPNSRRTVKLLFARKGETARKGRELQVGNPSLLERRKSGPHLSAGHDEKRRMRTGGKRARA